MAAYGVLTPGGKLSKAKRNKKKLARFAEAFSEKYGSYTSYMKKWRERKKKEVERAFKDDEGGALGKALASLPLNDFIKLSEQINKLLSRVYELYDSDSAREIEKEARKMDEYSAVNYLQWVISQRESNPEFNPLAKDIHNFSSEEVQEMMR